jgi:K+-sensing histidine kinase KdpD
MRSNFINVGKFGGAAIAVAAIALTTAIQLPFREYLNPTEVALTLVLIVLFASTLFGSRAGLAASIAGILCFNFFFLPPFHTLNISGPENWTAFAAFLITALIAGQLSGYARRRAEESEERQREIERLYDELKGAFEKASEAEALRRSEKLKSSLLDAVTHDLRTPLTSIKASVTTLLDDEGKTELDDESRNEFLEIINEETDRLNEFIEGMVGIAKVEAGAMHHHRAESSVEEIIANAVQRARSQTADHQVDVEVAHFLSKLNVDPVSISEVIFTLIDNAAKYSEKGTTIRIASHAEKTKIRIEVEDQGRGISLADREKIFDKFFRVSNMDIHQTGSGLGLGLAIARGIVESQGGRIWVEDGSEGFITKFVVEFETV